MTSIFHITGGLGKHVASTSVIESYKNTYPEKDIIVSCAYPDVFKNNPNVSESLDINRNQYFYKNYIYGKDIEIFAQDPYKQQNHILKRSNLIDTWCDMIGIQNSSDPILHFNFRELEYASNIISFNNNLPILIFQPFGGPLNQQIPYSWTRDIHPIVAQSIVDKLKDKYNIVHICNPQHPQLNSVTRLDTRLSPMVLFGILKHSHRRILIDSCLQHAAKALNLSSLVVWVATRPDIFGYTSHNNILPETDQPLGKINSSLYDYELTGIVEECPYSSIDEIFSDKLYSIIDNNF